MPTGNMRTGPHDSDELDPLLPRPITSYGPSRYLPILRYYWRYNPSAMAEYNSSISEIVDLLKSFGYNSYSIVMTHAGYEERDSVPVILACAAELTNEHAILLIEKFQRMEFKVIWRLFCFKGETKCHEDASDLQMYNQDPSPGHSIGVTNRNTSSSMGPYIQLGNETAKFCITVQHGISDTVMSINRASPRIQVQQPSYPDFRDERDRLRKQVELARVDNPRSRASHVSLSQIQQELSQLEHFNLEFGVVDFAERTVVTFNSQRMNADWAIIRVKEGREGINRIPIPYSSGIKRSVTRQWGPRDANGLYCTGSGPLDIGMDITKAGRTSGMTEGCIEIVYSHTKLEGSAEETNEYCVVSESPAKLFSEKGDSGAVTMNRVGECVGIVLGGTYGCPMKLEGHESLGELYVSYITPIELVMQRVQAMTGMDVKIDVPDLEKRAREDVEIIR